MFKRVLWIVIAVVVLIQFVPVDRSNPPEKAPLHATLAVDEMIDRCCADCHSNRTVWPWYAYVAPVSWLVGHDVKEARSHLNFSNWGEMTEHKRTLAAEEMVEHVTKEEMPPANYLRMHKTARVTAAELRELRGWAVTIGAQLDKRSEEGDLGDTQ